MFNLGSDDKDELQENMKEIKNLINQKEQDGAQNQGESLGEEMDGFERETSNQQGNNQRQQDFNAGPNQNSVGQGKLENQRTSQDTRTQVESDPRQRTQENPSKQQPQRPQESEKSLSSPGNSDNTTTRSRPDRNRSTKTSKNLEEASVINEQEDQESKGRQSTEPLFLREEEFTDVREMAEEMNYLTQELAQKVERMKKTVRNERDVSKDSEELVKAFNQRKSKIRSTIGSGKK